MKSNRRSSATKKSRRLHRTWAWMRRRRRVMAAHALRGASYSAGTGIVGLLFWWFEQRL
ncbi:hypothetical protein [Streptomyces sp. A5-4]|uniref:hypothetical protein n=1 Tax=Streptomyces sp. A5-4 TaxID=3384771 RepID=UPI003DA8AC6A